MRRRQPDNRHCRLRLDCFTAFADDGSPAVIARRNDEAIHSQATTWIASGCTLDGDGDFRDSRMFGKCIIYF
jgi:hypothetical protein